MALVFVSGCIIGWHLSRWSYSTATATPTVCRTALSRCVFVSLFFFAFLLAVYTSILGKYLVLFGTTLFLVLVRTYARTYVHHPFLNKRRFCRSNTHIVYLVKVVFRLCLWTLTGHVRMYVQFPFSSTHLLHGFCMGATMCVCSSH